MGDSVFDSLQDYEVADKLLTLVRRTKGYNSVQEKKHDGDFLVWYKALDTDHKARIKIMVDNLAK
jgi:hypothetical protein